ncbi:PREDICTED: death-associated protein kinase 1-like [Branchiostoma belcheri]|uniref:Death-associated protein kinase 1-like n=1 Tax=Branchiostoma belcheri TaxID=7741 RepID=A0A6P4ZN35_BRABE|nr:PREDICTED: death-associated protein kinase 1-like [Branchiostoma belcheri]
MRVHLVIKVQSPQSLAFLFAIASRDVAAAAMLDHGLLWVRTEEMDLDKFFRAVERGDVQTVRRGLDAGVDVKERTSLHVASRYGQTAVAELLIKHGADLEARGEYEKTSLHVASGHGQTAVAELLIKHGADLEARDDDQDTPLHDAAVEGHTGTCELLIRHGADVTARSVDQDAPLHRAADRGHTGTCELLIRHGADVMARNKDQDTPLHRAAEKGHTGTCELLIRHGAEAVTARNEYQNTPLHWAALRGHTGTCELLIRHGADVTARDKDQNTPLHDAAAGGHTGTNELLIRHGADVTARNEDAVQERSFHELLQKSGGVKTDRCKTFVFGMAGTGKSTLKISLIRGLVPALLQAWSKSSSAEEPHDPTPGVDVGTFHIPGVGEVSLWDFAGQSEYAVTHSMFMDAENTIFIVLYNIEHDTETQEKQVHWWLCFIKSCNPNRQPDVILVASHGDKVSPNTGKRRAAQLLQLMTSEFNDHLRISDEVILMNCKETRTPEMDRLKKLLAKMKTSMLEHQRKMPKLCAEITKQLPSWCQKKCSPKCPVLRWPGYLDAVKEIDPHVDEDFLRESTRYLDHLGEIIFICPSSSDPIIVLKPNWLCTDVIGPMMAPVNFPIPRLEGTSEDYVTREEIKRVFQDVADVDLLITLLQEFQLCHSYDGQTFIFPGLLTQTMPADKWQPTSAHEPKVVYFGKQVQCADSTDMFSSGFFPQVQTRLMREQENRPRLWRDGAKCVDGDVEGLIKLSPDGRTVNICVRSVQGDKEQCGKMLQQLENIIAEVLEESSPGTGTVEKVLSARALKEHREEFYSYGMEEISKAAAEGGRIVHPILGFTEQVSDLLYVETPLTRNRPELVQALRHVEPILDHLQARDILTVEECDVIRANATPQDRARALLDTVGRKGEDALRVFQSVLGEVDARAADMLMATRQADEVQDREDHLTRHRPELVQALRHVEPVLDHLQVMEVLSTEECDVIRAKGTPQDRARALLDIVGTKGGDARQVFKVVLEEVHPEAAEMME